MAEESRVLRISFVGDFSDVNAGLNRLEQRAGQPIAVGGAAAGASSAGGATIVNDSIPQSTSRVSNNVTIQSDTGGGFSVGGTFGGGGRLAGDIENAQRRQLRAAERLADATERQARVAESAINRGQSVVNPAGNAVGTLRGGTRNSTITPSNTGVVGAFSADEFQAQQYRRLFRSTINDLNDPSSRVGTRSPSRASLRGTIVEHMAEQSDRTGAAMQWQLRRSGSPGRTFELPDISPMGLSPATGGIIDDDGTERTRGRGQGQGQDRGGGRSQWGRLRRVATGGYAAYFGLETLSRVRDYNNENTLAGNNQSQQLQNTQSLIGQISSVPFLGQAASLLADPSGRQNLAVQFAQQQAAIGGRIGDIRLENASSRLSISDRAGIAQSLPGLERDRKIAETDFEEAKRIAQARVRPLTEEQVKYFDSRRAQINTEYKDATFAVDDTPVDYKSAQSARDKALGALNIERDNAQRSSASDVAAETAKQKDILDAAIRDLTKNNALAILSQQASGLGALLGAGGTRPLGVSLFNIESQRSIDYQRAAGNPDLQNAINQAAADKSDATKVDYDTDARRGIIDSQNRGAVVNLIASGQIHGGSLRRIQNERQGRLLDVREGPLANRQRREINNESDEERDAENTDFDLRNQADARSLTDRRDELKMRAEGRDKSAQAKEIADAALRQSEDILAPFRRSGDSSSDDFRAAQNKSKLILEGGQAAEQNYLRELNLQALGRASSGQGIGLGGIGGGNNNSAQGQESVAKGIEGVKTEIAKLAVAILGIY